MDNFTKIVQVPHKFDHGSERNIVVFSKDTEEQRAALAAGASLAGGVELIKQVQNGQLNLAVSAFILHYLEYTNFIIFVFRIFNIT